MSRLAILEIIRTKHQNTAWLLLILYYIKTSQLSLFYCHTLAKLSFLMTTSYTVLQLTVLKISIKKGLFSFWLFIVSYSDFWYYRSLLYYGGFKKIRKKQKQIKNNTLKIMKVLRTRSLGSNFIGCYKKENVVHCVKISFY